MFRSPLNLFRTDRSQSPTEHTPTGRTPGSSPGTSSRTSPVHTELSPRGRHRDEAAQSSLRPRGHNFLARLTGSPPRRPAAEGSTTGPSSPQSPHAGGGRTGAEREVADWKQQAMAQPPLVGPGFKYTNEKGADGRQESLDGVGKAVVRAFTTQASSLQIQYMPARNLPPLTWNIKTLKELDVNFSPELTKLSENIANLKEMTKLSVLGSPLESLPTAIGGLPLATLSLSGGSYETLPLGFTRLSGSLQNLDISHSQPARGGGGGLKELPADIGALKLLQNLKISGHKELTAIPASVGNLTELRTLDFSKCPKLTSIPDLSKLSNLKTLNLSGCTGLRARPEWLGQLPSNCKVTLPRHLTQQAHAPEAAHRSGGFHPRSPEETAQRQQKLGRWTMQLQPFAGERGAARFNHWMGATVRKEGQGPADMRQLDAVVKAAAASPAFRAELFEFAADNVKFLRNADGVRQPGPPTVGATTVRDAGHLLINHQVSHSRTNSSQAYGMLRKMATDETSTAFSRELMAFCSPSPGGARLQQAPVPTLLEAYVKTHDEGGKAIMETRRSLESKQGRNSGPDEAEAHAVAMQPLEELLRRRCLEVATQLLGYA